MELQQLFQWLEDTAIGTAIRSSELLFPLIESLHVLCITVVVGSIAVVDIRLLGVGASQRAASKLMDDVLPITRWAFAAAAITGGLLFTSHAVSYSSNTAFQIKMVVLAVALVNIVYFHRVTARGIASWDSTPSTPPAVKMAGGLSLMLWILVVGTGRWIGFL